MSLKILPAALAVLLCSGCATVVRGRSEAWTVNTQPIDAVVTLSNGQTCHTPCALQLRRKYPFAVDICKAGYKRVVTQVVSTIHGAGAAGLAGNVILGGIVGAGVDVGTGAGRDLEPNPLQVTLEADQPGCLAPTGPVAPPDADDPPEPVKAPAR